MTTATSSMVQPAARDRLGAWCGAVMVGGAVLIPPITWLSPMGFAALAALMGLLCLPAIRMRDEDRPVMAVLFALLLWAAVSTTWSPYKPRHMESSPIVELALGLPLFWSAVCGARRADPRLNALALRILRWGLVALSALLLLDVKLDAGFYRHLHETYYEPIRIDLARVNLAHSTYVTGVLWPAVMIGAIEKRWHWALAAFVIAGTVITAHVFAADAPVLAAPLSAVAMVVLWRWPTLGPRLAAGLVAAVGFAMPSFVWLLRSTHEIKPAEGVVEASWAVRLDYWSHALDWIEAKPLRGWGLESARAMGPAIQLHPHNGAIQMWLDLGVAGAIGASAFWALCLLRLQRPKSDLAMAAVCGSMAAYVLFAWVNFGAWQGWWLGLGAMVPMLAAMLENRTVMAKSTSDPISR